MAFEAYHNVTGPQHQANFDRLYAKGYRIISLSVYGPPADARYAAVWVERAGPAWVGVHGVNSAGYQSSFNTWTAKGYVPNLITATGDATNAIFAATFEQVNDGPWVARHGMTAGPEANAGTFQYQNKQAWDSKLILHSFAIYGTASDRRYVAIWRSNPGYTKWHAHLSDTSGSYQTAFNAETSLPWYRPAYVTLSSDQIYCSVFKDNMVGPWVARHGLTSGGYQAEFDSQNARGFYPISVQGGGSGADTRFAAIFAQRDIPEQRVLSATGAAVPGLDGFDKAMMAFMQANAVRAGQLTVSKNGVTKLARAYTWAEPDYPLTQPTTQFLLASCSKMFLAAAVQTLYDAHKLTPSTAVYPLLGFSSPADSRSDTITIQQLLDHMGGYDDTATGSRFDPTYSMRTIALSLSLPGAASKRDIARYMYARPLDFAPGTNTKYSNYGYLLASLVVERVTGVEFSSYLQSAVLAPQGISGVSVFPTRPPPPAGDAIPEDQGLGLSALDPRSPFLVPAVYGGDGEIKEVGAACAGLAASATALTQFIHRNAVWGSGPRPANGAGGWTLTRTGSTPGTSTLASSRGDGVDWAYVFNTRDWPPLGATSLDALFGEVVALLDSGVVV